MNEGARGLALIIVSTTLCAAPTLAADPASDVSVTKDLTAVIALQGMPCGEVVSATKQGENDYIAACRTATATACSRTRKVASSLRRSSACRGGPTPSAS